MIKINAAARLKVMAAKADVNVAIKYLNSVTGLKFAPKDKEIDKDGKIIFRTKPTNVADLVKTLTQKFGEAKASKTNSSNTYKWNIDTSGKRQIVVFRGYGSANVSLVDADHLGQ